MKYRIYYGVLGCAARLPITLICLLISVIYIRLGLYTVLISSHLLGNNKKYPLGSPIFIEMRLV